MVDGDPAVKRITDFARHLEGVARNASTHAAGVVISREPLTELMPLQKATNSDGLMSQYEMHAIEALGLLKFDFLGLSNLTILRQAVDLVRDNRGIEIDLDDIPLDDATTFELLASGETTGVFQLESAGMRRYVRDLRPTSVYDLAAMVALYRPGPMDNIPAYIRRKHGQEPVTYLHPLLEPYLEKTYGIFVYQEDIMSAAIALGGFTGPGGGHARLRDPQEEVGGAARAEGEVRHPGRGARRRAANVIDAVFKAFEPFERYGFNKAHATCYGLIAYQTAYMKANHTVEYMTAVLTAFRSNEEKVAAAVAECRRMGIEVLPPDVHTSHLEFTVEGDAIRFGLLAVKNVGQGAIESIIAARDEGGDVPLADRLLHADRPAPGQPQGARGAGQGRGARARSGIRRRSCSGSTTRSRRPRRRSATGSAARPRCSTWAPTTRRRSSGRCPTATEVPVRERLRWEKELLGLYLSEHPMGEVAEQVGRFVTAYSSDLRDESLDGQRVVVGGIVTGVRTVITKAKATMAIVTLEDLQGTHRGRRLPAALRADDGHVARRRDPARRRPGRPQERGGLVARRPRGRVGRGGCRRRGELRAAGGRRGSWRWRTAAGWPERRRVGWGTRQRAATGLVPTGGPSARPGRSRGSRSGSRPASASPVARLAATRPPSSPAIPYVSPRRAGAAPVGGHDRRDVAAADRAGRTRLGLPRDAGRRPGSRPGRRAVGPGRGARPDRGRRDRRCAGRRRSTTRSSTSGSPAAPRPIAWSARWRRSRRCCATGRARPGWSSTSRHRAAARPPMELRRGVAYDAELLAEVRRRLGDGLVELRLASA